MTRSLPAAKKSSMKVLDEGVSKGGQDVVAFRILVQDGQVFRFTARSDAYDDQCSAKIEHWDPVQGGWNLVHALPPGLMQTPSKLQYDPSGARWSHFEKDFARLFAVATAVLSAASSARPRKAAQTAQ